MLSLDSYRSAVTGYGFSEIGEESHRVRSERARFAHIEYAVMGTDVQCPMYFKQMPSVRQLCWNLNNLSTTPWCRGVTGSREGANQCFYVYERGYTLVYPFGTCSRAGSTASHLKMKASRP